MSSRLLRPARWLTFILGAALSLLAVYSFGATFQMVIRNPALVLPDSLWTAAQLESALAGLGLPGTFYAIYALGIGLVLSLTFLICGWLILLRRSRDWFGLYLALLLLTCANGTGVFVLIPPSSPWIDMLSEYLGWFAFPGLWMLPYLFPSGQVTPRWARWFAWGLGLFIVYGLATTILDILSDYFIYFIPLIIAILLVGIYAQIYRYRHAGMLERQQIKLVVFSLVLFAAFFIFLATTQNITGLGDPQHSGLTRALFYNIALFTIGNLALMSMPISIAVAMMRYRLWDVDIVIRRTLVYGALTLTLALVYFGSVVLLQNLFTAVSGQQSPVAIVVSTLLIAALFTPLRRRIQNDIDRRFYRKKYDAEKTIAAFSAGLRQEVDLEQIGERLLVVVEETMQPEQVSLWLKDVKRQKIS